MKVFEIIEKIDELRSIQDYLKLMNTVITPDNDSVTIYRAVEAIEEYIRELMIKEVKE